MIRLNSPKLNYLMIAGVIIVYLGCIVIIIPTLNTRVVSALCIVCMLKCNNLLACDIHIDFSAFQIRIWLLPIGHSFGFGTVIAKLVRIYYIFK